MSEATEAGLSKKIKHYCWAAADKAISGITCVSPKLNTMLRYKMVYGAFPDLKHPSTFSEKLCWLKLKRYMRDPLVIQCADKYRVREYVEQKGCGELLNELYGVYDSADMIPWEELPDQFVLKWNFGAGKNLVCRDKSKYSAREVAGQFREWGKDKCWLAYSELQYKYIPRKIVCEKYLEDDLHSNALPDYKVYCFHGEPLIVLVIQDRGQGTKAQFFDCDWNALENPKYPRPEKDMERPGCLQQMLDSARLLSEPFPFVRADFYVVNGRLYFGELTFTPAGGLYMSQTKINGKDMSEYLKVP